MNICSMNNTQPDLPDTGGTCCYGAVIYGPGRCTCWTPVFDLEQAEPDQQLVTWLAAGIEPNTRQRMCHGCAYRPNSPEQSDDPTYLGDHDELERIAREDRFWCHQGMRRPVAWRHPTSVEVPGHPGGYQPPIVNNVPYKADGTPGELCAGWAARHRAVDATRSPRKPGKDGGLPWTT